MYTMWVTQIKKIKEAEVFETLSSSHNTMDFINTQDQKYACSITHRLCCWK